MNIANELAEAGVKILGTTPETIDLAEDRDRFRKIMNKLEIPQPESGMASTLEEAIKIAGQNRISPDGKTLLCAGRPGNENHPG